jgi:hypothetical protein
VKLRAVWIRSWKGSLTSRESRGSLGRFLGSLLGSLIVKRIMGGMGWSLRMGVACLGRKVALEVIQ